jgi:DNA mismatch endonuclease (patch repair protein)
MTDTVSRAKRSQIMAAIRSTGNKNTELKMARTLRAHAITGWRRHQPLPGRPDFVFRRERLAVFIDGCFWHGCRSHCRMPKTSVGYWNPKIARNKRRDRAVNALLRAHGWRVYRIWEHSLGAPARVVSQLRTLLSQRDAMVFHETAAQAADG